MAKRNYLNQEDTSLYAESDHESDNQLAEYPDLGDLMGSLNGLSPEALNEVTETVLSALSEQDSPLASKEEVLRQQDELWAMANTHANARNDARPSKVPEYPQIVPKAGGHAHADPSAAKRVYLDSL